MCIIIFSKNRTLKLLQWQSWTNISRDWYRVGTVTKYENQTERNSQNIFKHTMRESLALTEVIEMKNVPMFECVP